MSQSIDSAAVLKAVEDFQDPETGRSVVTMKQVHDIRVEGSDLHVTLALSTFCSPIWSETRDDFKQVLSAAFPDMSVHVGEKVHDRPPEKERGVWARGKAHHHCGVRQGWCRQEYDCHRTGVRFTKIGLQSWIHGCRCLWAEYSAPTGHHWQT